MSEEIVFKRWLKLPAAIGDWTKLKAASAAEKKVRPGLFRFDRLGEAELKQIHHLHYQLSEALVLKMSRDLKLKLVLRAVTAEQYSYQSFQDKHPENRLQIDLHSATGQRFFIYYDLPLLELLMNRALGGKGKDIDHRDLLSDLDLEASRTILAEYQPLLEKFWKLSGRPLSMDLHHPDLLPDSAIAAKDGVVVIRLEIGYSDDQAQQIIFLYSNKVLRQLLSQLDARPWMENIQLKEKTQASLLIPVRVELGETELLMKDLEQLEEGDVIQLNKPLGETIDIFLDDKVHLQGQMASRQTTWPFRF